MVQVCGHRGAGGLHPENTLASIRHAVDLGVHSVECDVHRTRDGHPVVIHDETVNRTTNGKGKVAELDLETIRAMDAGEGQQVPTLCEVLDVVRGRTHLLCELKAEGVVAPAVRCVQEYGMLDQVTFLGFHPVYLEQVRRLEKSAQVSACFWNPRPSDIERAVELGAGGVEIHFLRLNYHLTRLVRQAGLFLRTFTPNLRHEQDAMIALGVDAITTDRPDLLLAPA